MSVAPMNSERAVGPSDARRAHSPAATTTTARVTAPHARGGSPNSAASVSGIRTSAVMMRVLSTLRSIAYRLQLLAGPAEPSLALPIRIDRRAQCVSIEVRPQEVGKIKFGVGELPEQKIRYALLAAGSYEQVRLR